MLPGATPVDTDPAASSALLTSWRAMSVADRAELVRQLCLDLERVARAGILASNPHATELEIAGELTRRRYGDDLANEACGGALLGG